MRLRFLPSKQEFFLLLYITSVPIFVALPKYVLIFVSIHDKITAKSSNEWFDQFLLALVWWDIPITHHMHDMSLARQQACRYWGWLPSPSFLDFIFEYVQ